MMIIHAIKSHPAFWSLLYYYSEGKTLNCQELKASQAQVPFYSNSQNVIANPMRLTACRKELDKSWYSKHVRNHVLTCCIFSSRNGRLRKMNDDADSPKL